MADITIPSGVTSATYNVVSGEKLSLYGTIESASVEAGGSMLIYDGGIVEEATINGALRVYAGGTITNFTILDPSNAQAQNSGRKVVESGTIEGGSLRLTGADANYLTLNSGTLVFQDGTTATTTVVNGGSLSAGGYGGGTTTISATDTTVNAGAAMHVSTYAEVKNTIVNGGKMFVYSGANAIETTVQNGAQVSGLEGASFADTTVQSSTYFELYGATATNTNVSGTNAKMFLHANGSANDTTVENGGRLYLDKLGATATNTTLLNGAKLSAYDEATDAQIIKATVDNGATLYLACGTATDTDVLAGGSMHVLDGATAEKTTVRTGAAVFAVSNGATIIDTVLEDADVKEKAFVFSAGVMATNTTIGSGWVISALGTMDGVTVEEGANLKISAGAAVSNLNVLKGGSAGSIYVPVTNAKIAGYASLKPGEGKGALTGKLEFSDGADLLINGGGDYIVIDNGTSTSGDAPDTQKSAVMNGSILALDDGMTIESEGDFFINGNNATIQKLTLDFTDDGKLYAGSLYDADSADATFGTELRINNVDMTGFQAFGGGKIVGGTATLSGDTSLKLQGDTKAARVYAGFDVLATADSTASITGDSTLTIEDGTYNYVRGGVLKSDGNGGALTVTGNAETKVTGTFQSVVGDYQVGAGASFTREGNVTLAIHGSETSITGSVVGAGVSYGGEYTLTGNCNINIFGGTFTGNIYGGVTVGTTGAIAISETCTIDGNTSITIRCDDSDITLGKEGQLTSIFVGSYAMGDVTGIGTLTFKNIGGDDYHDIITAGNVEFIGDSSGATTKNSYVGSSTLHFAKVIAEFDHVINIAGFDTVINEYGSNVTINDLVVDNLADVGKWTFAALENDQVAFDIDGSIADEENFAGLFYGDRIELEYNTENFTGSCTLINDVNGLGLFDDLGENTTVVFNKETATYGEGAFTANGYKLWVDGNALKFGVIA